MDVLWERRQATVAEVSAALPGPPIAYSSVLTTMRILEQKGYVAHEEEGRAFVYHPVVERAEAAKSAVGQLVSKFFANSPGELALKLVAEERPSDEELQRLKTLIEKYEEGRS